MDFRQRIVSETPLRQIWNDHGVVNAKEIRELNASDIAKQASRNIVI